MEMHFLIYFLANCLKVSSSACPSQAFKVHHFSFSKPHWRPQARLMAFLCFCVAADPPWHAERRRDAPGAASASRGPRGHEQQHVRKRRRRGQESSGMLLADAGRRQLKRCRHQQQPPWRIRTRLFLILISRVNIELGLRAGLCFAGFLCSVYI